MTNRNNKNHLKESKSPYLLQHAENPVHWFEWNEDAFDKAKRQNKPIFLSIGYSTCHWCHVMAHESFEDDDVAELLNKDYISIKVDREEYPHIDSQYMMVAQAMTGSGGWPLTIIMTPGKKPFFAATYIPKHSKWGRTGLIELLPKIADHWRNNKADIDKVTMQVANMLQTVYNSSNKEQFNSTAFDTAFTYFKNSYDKEYGGFGTSPKFPTAHNYLFLLRAGYYDKNNAEQMVSETLKKIRLSGVYDQLGYGFHRYSTDKKWLVPHFEKMLYDQALLSFAYTEAYQLTNDTFYKEVANEIFEYVLRDMRSSHGGFYTAEDADSEGEEGIFYIWDSKEIFSLFDANGFNKTEELFNIKQNGNYLEEATQKYNGKNILYIGKEMAEDFISIKHDKQYEFIRKTLFNNREKREHPFKDNKIVTDWNALMTASFAYAGRAFENKDYLAIAKEAYSFIRNKLYNQRLFHLYNKGLPSGKGNLNDYASLIFAQLELYESTFNTKYLNDAVLLTNQAVEYFFDNKKTAFNLTAHDEEKVLVKVEEYQDGAIPSANSIMYRNLFRLGRLTGEARFEKYAEYIVQRASSRINQHPYAYTMLLSGLLDAQNNFKEIIITGNKNNPETQNIIRYLQTRYIPNKIIVFKNDQNDDEINSMVRYIKEYPINEKKPAVFICENYTCQKPVYSLSELKKII